MYEIRLIKGGTVVGFDTRFEKPSEAELSELVSAADADYADVCREEDNQ